MREQEHMEAMAKEHDKLLGARMQRRRAEDMLKWYKERAAHAQWLKAALGKLERYYTRLGVEQEELRAQMAARDQVDSKILRDLRQENAEAVAKLAQTKPLRCVAQGAGKGSGRRGSRKTYPDWFWFYMVALGLIAQSKTSFLLR